MLQIALVIFREMLEISLILGIVLAAAKPIKGHQAYVAAGAMCGFVLAALLAFGANKVTTSFGGFGDELLDVAIILLTVVMVSSTAIWVKHTGAKISAKITKIAENSDDTNGARIMLLLVVMTTIFREATEVVLFIHAIASSGMLEVTDYVGGFMIGIVAGIGTALAISYGLNKVAVKHLFKISFILLSLIAASLATEAAGILTSLGVVDILSAPMWDSGEYISDYGIIGKILKIFVGYNSKPNGLEVLFYLATLGFIYFASRWGKGGKKQNAKTVN